jgi:hypothetical protein
MRALLLCLLVLLALLHASPTVAQFASPRVDVGPLGCTLYGSGCNLSSFDTASMNAALLTAPPQCNATLLTFLAIDLRSIPSTGHACSCSLLVQQALMRHCTACSFVSNNRLTYLEADLFSTTTAGKLLPPDAKIMIDLSSVRTRHEGAGRSGNAGSLTSHADATAAAAAVTAAAAAAAAAAALFPLPFFLLSSRNNFSSSDVLNLWNTSVATPSVFGSREVELLDLSYNPLGPTVPASFASAPKVRYLYLVSTGLTSVQSNAFNGSTISSLDLSLNDLREGLKTASAGASGGVVYAASNAFHGITPFPGDPATLALSNCNLAADSLLVDLFPPTGNRILYADNLDLTPGAMEPQIASASFQLPRFPFLPFAPKWILLAAEPAPPLDTRIFRASMFAATTPFAAEQPTLPTTAQWQSALMNYFSVFPAGLLKLRVDGSSPWWRVEIGAVGRLDRWAFWDFTSGSGRASMATGAVLVVSLAPASIVASSSGSTPTTPATPYCPLHTVSNALSFPNGGVYASVPSMILHGVHIKAWGLSPSSTDDAQCEHFNCAEVGGCQAVLSPTSAVAAAPLLILPFEPRGLLRSALYGFEQLTQNMQVSWGAPQFNLWNRELNHSAWMPADMLCGGNVVSSYRLPALPQRDRLTGLGSHFPFAPPANRLRCVSSSTLLTSLDWTSAKLFSADMLSGFIPTTPTRLSLDVQTLYAGNVSVPATFFDGVGPLMQLVPTYSLLGDAAANATTALGCGPTGLACANIESRCPSIVSQACRECEAGQYVNSFDNIVDEDPTLPFYPHHGLFYCSACPAGRSENRKPSGITSLTADRLLLCMHCACMLPLTRGAFFLFLFSFCLFSLGSVSVIPPSLLARSCARLVPSSRRRGIQCASRVRRGEKKNAHTRMHRYAPSGALERLETTASDGCAHFVRVHFSFCLLLLSAPTIPPRVPSPRLTVVLALRILTSLSWANLPSRAVSLVLSELHSQPRDRSYRRLASPSRACLATTLQTAPRSPKPAALHYARGVASVSTGSFDNAPLDPMRIRLDSGHAERAAVEARGRKSEAKRSRFARNAHCRPIRQRRSARDARLVSPVTTHCKLDPPHASTACRL